MSPYCQANFVTTGVRVALIVAGGKIKPVWFEEIEQSSKDRVLIKTVNYVGAHQEGAAKIIDFSVTGRDDNCYQLKLNTREFTWQLWINETTQSI